MTTNLNLIYALLDPRTNEIRYIGKTNKGIKRAYQHKKAYSLKSETHKNHWIKQLLSEGLEYNVKILEICESKEITSEREQYWIKFHKELGTKLTNATDGGEGTLGREYKPETIEKMSKIRKEFYEEHPEVAKAVGEKQRKHHENIDGIEQKHCADCHNFKPLIEFSVSKGNWDELKHICKECNNSRTEEYRQETFVKMTEEQWKQSYEDRKEAMRQGVIENYKNNPETKKKQSASMSKAIIATSVDNPSVKIEFTSALKAKEAGFQNSNIGQAIKYKKTYKGYTWKFKS